MLWMCRRLSLGRPPWSVSVLMRGPPGQAWLSVLCSLSLMWADAAAPLDSCSRELKRPRSVWPHRPAHAKHSPVVVVYNMCLFDWGWKKLSAMAMKQCTTWSQVRITIWLDTFRYWFFIVEGKVFAHFVCLVFFTLNNFVHNIQLDYTIDLYKNEHATKTIVA